MGDLNARSTAWGDTYVNPRGPLLEEWAAELGLLFINRGTEPTCVRPQGVSRVDVTLASSNFAWRLSRWEVIRELETFSDHRYIRFVVNASVGPPLRPRTSRRTFPRWTVGRLNRERAEEVAIVKAWCADSTPVECVEEGVRRLQRNMTEVCNASMPKWRPPPQRKAIYWWTREIEDFRRVCSGARRAYLRSCRRRSDDPQVREGLRLVYCRHKKVLQVAILDAKNEAHKKFLKELDSDPWGRPYQAARKRLKGAGAPLTETLEPALLDRVISGLFPLPPNIVPPRMVTSVVDGDVDREQAPEVTDSEIESILCRLKSRKKAPGPDGLHARVLAVTFPYMGETIRGLFDLCLRSGRFPTAWKEGQLCLIRKEGRAPNSPGAYRPIILLDEAGKALEWIIASRLGRHLSIVGPDLDEAQYGFRAGRSTIDALMDLKQYTKRVVERGGRALAVSLDIANAFFNCIFRGSPVLAPNSRELFGRTTGGSCERTG
ncbi:unnamed protein product [Pieris macdunnoughi]|uniref:Reverse transcriptase n=1 Tax=Pieris macdunnoughi TaxID=345717 RepID=A0A821WRL1_9NEOP|nr:unnamed protein product [Pieris macdunnoughi]